MLESGERRFTCNKSYPRHWLDRRSRRSLGEFHNPSGRGDGGSVTQPVEQAPLRCLQRLPRRAAFPSTRSGEPAPTPSALRTWKLSTEILILKFYPMSPLVLKIGRHGQLPMDRRRKPIIHKRTSAYPANHDCHLSRLKITKWSFGPWLIQCVTNAISAAAQLSDATQDRITFCSRRDQNLVVVSTPDLDIAKKIQQITTLNMESKQCSACETVNPVPDRVCVPRCANCHADHPATDPRCPVRQRRRYNKTHVLRSLASTNRSPPFPPPATTQQWREGETGSLQSSATTERPIADSELPSTESVRCSKSHDRRHRDRGRSASHGQSKVPGCSREASDSWGNQAPPNFWPQRTNLKAMRTDLQAQFTATIQKLQAYVDELRQQHTRTLQHYTATIDEIWSQLKTHHESLQNELRTPVTDAIRES
ncbi:hypothetical protein HPB48_005719 [Haemaphysalis longicornis]|uniref:Uncharacterized protein n=1 Tax=Haemaphysalis longicornis TaxID=44386 RepID=A0A9J6FBU6_HAELO|nr:hypothetical protein HPB48_005719 [Haemaphysalis longicornis]